MKQRCTNPDHPSYPGYGGRGITICQRWLDSFENFFEDMGPRPPDRSIDRIDNDGNYEPSNCRWATHTQQRLNQRPSLGKYAISDGHQIQSLQAWSRERGVRSRTLLRQILDGYEPHLYFADDDEILEYWSVGS